MHMNATFAFVLSALAHLILSSSAVAEDRAVAKPNFVIIFTDDQGYGDLGCFGSTKIKTPHIDLMAKEGCRFTRYNG